MLYRVILIPAGVDASYESPSGETLVPRMIDAGPHAGRYILPAHVLDNSEFDAVRASLLAMEQVDLDTDAAWPPQPEPKE